MAEHSTSVLVLDMATLRFRFAANRRTLTVLTGPGETLASVTMRPAEEDTDVIFRALTEAGRTSCVLRADGAGNIAGHQLALYNPYTAQVSWAGPGGPFIFAAETPVAIPAEGVVAAVRDDESGRELTIGGAVVAELIPDATTVARTLTAYR